MEGKKFINILKKNRNTLIAVEILVIAIAFILVRKLPDEYTSRATLSAGIVDQSQQLLTDKENLQQEKTNQAFSNLTSMMQMKTVYDQVSYQLMLHDLTNDVPYRKPSKQFGYLNPDARKHAIEVYTRLYNTKQPLDLQNNDQKGLNDVIISMKYDYASLAKKIKISRVENSDFISVEFESESRNLSMVVVNTLCTEFIAYYTKITKENELKSIDFLSKLLADKKDSLDQKMLTLEKFKIRNRLLNPAEQAKTLDAQIADYESRLEIVQKDTAANGGALRGLDRKFSGNGRQYQDSRVTAVNQDILLNKERLRVLNEEYIKSNFDTSYLSKINAIKDQLSEQINQSADNYMVNPLSAKEGLVTQRLTLEVNQDIAKNSIKSIRDELNKLNAKFDTLLPNEAVIQQAEGAITVASQEYLNILNKYNETSLEYNSSVKLKLIEMATLGELQPSKKLLLVGISGVASFVFCLLVLFILFYLDDSIQTPVELADNTNNPVLGYLPLLKTTALIDLNTLWRNSVSPEVEDYKNQLRSLRFEIDNVLPHGTPVLNITSLSPNVGKTIFALSLGSAYLLINKRVLLIDGNFDNPSVTKITKPKYYIEDYLTGKLTMPLAVKNNEIFILGNYGQNTSLFEISNESNIHERMSELKKQFDVILIESSALNLLNRSKEWNIITDKIVCVYESGKVMSDEEKQEVRYLNGSNNKFIGWVMNKLQLEGNEPPKKLKFF